MEQRMATSGIDRRYFCSIFSEVPGYGIRVLYIDCLRRSERIEICTTNPEYEVLTSYLSSITVVAHFWNDLVSNMSDFSLYLSMWVMSSTRMSLPSLQQGLRVTRLSSHCMRWGSRGLSSEGIKNFST